MHAITISTFNAYIIYLILHIICFQYSSLYVIFSHKFWALVFRNSVNTHRKLMEINGKENILLPESTAIIINM